MFLPWIGSNTWVKINCQVSIRFVFDGLGARDVYMPEKYLRERDGRHGQEKIKTTTIFWESAVSNFLRALQVILLFNGGL